MGSDGNGGDSGIRSGVVDVEGNSLRESGDGEAKAGGIRKGVLDLSLGALAQDLLDVVEATKVRMGWERLPGCVLVGHSLGGAVVTHVAMGGELGAALLGYAVLDVVEGGSFVFPFLLTCTSMFGGYGTGVSLGKA
jgi:pimeloyl-ACP methyl ester carboxylesterase